MKIIGIEEEENKVRKISRKKIVIASIISIILMAIIIITIVYCVNKDFRNFWDKYILMKNVTENNLPSIAIDNIDSNNIYAYDKYIVVLKNNILTAYNVSGKEEYSENIPITTPIVDHKGRFFLIGEKNAKKIYLLDGNKKVWEKELEGNIARVSVNKNGYVAVVLTGTTYKSVIQIFNAEGKELFKTYLSNSTVMDVDISIDNRYVSFVEVSSDATIVQSSIKTISVEKTATEPSESIIYTSEMQTNRLPIAIHYQEQNKLVCFFDNEIDLWKDGKLEAICYLEEEGKKITFADIQLNNEVMRVIEKSSLLHTESTIEIINTENKNVSTYVLQGAIREIVTYDQVIALNLGSEVHFIGINGWLKKKYNSSQEIKKIIVTDAFAGIVYRDKIEIVSY